jgi:hypothetical protein
MGNVCNRETSAPLAVAASTSVYSAAQRTFELMEQNATTGLVLYAIGLAWVLLARLRVRILTQWHPVFDSYVNKRNTISVRLSH